MEYKMRGLGPDDIFMMATIINDIGVDEIKRCFVAPMQEMQGGESGEGLIEKIGIQVMGDMLSLIVSKIPRCRDSLYLFLESVYGLGERELRLVKPAVFVKLVKGVIQHEDMADFFTELLGLLGMAHTDSTTSSTDGTQIP